ncbi:MAG: hypothetical protein LDL31_11375 [Prosthecobacter sp.]|nr:hypothetical protein [Prosthecobacter sp.]
MRFLDKLESRFGRFAIPGLVQIVAMLQLGVFFIFVMMPPEARPAYFDFLALDVDGLMRGEIWRLVTFIFIPGTMHTLLAVISAMFLRWLGRGLEEAWGPFRSTLYFVGGMASVAVGALLFGYTATGLLLFQSLLLAFAVIYPNEEILLFFILPVRIRWIAWLNVVLTVLAVLGAPDVFWPVLFSHLNFLVTFGPGFLQQRQHLARVAERRAKFSAAKDGPAFFHQCSTCGKTEVDDPSLDFRVNDAGDEVCSACRQAAS